MNLHCILFKTEKKSFTSLCQSNDWCTVLRIIIFLEISPRLSYVASSSVVRIKESNDAYGVLNLEPSSIVIDEENRRVNLTVQRTGMSI